MTRAHVLVVDDEAAERVTLAEALRLEDYYVTLAASGEEVLRLIKDEVPFDLVILDLKLPGIDGLQVLEALHAAKPELVVILITGYATLETAIQALRKGAYDYLLKPCSMEEILATTRKGLSEFERERHRQDLIAQLQNTVQELADTEGGSREVLSAPSETMLQVADVVLDRSRHLATRDGQPVDLTPTEFRLLECLMEDADRVQSPQALIRCAQGYETDAMGARSIIRVHIRRLRTKLEPKPSDPRYIVNVRGVGYMFASEPEDAS
ncbi:MAG: response regulator transcription factor [Anaerolineae bacterium]